MADVKIHAGLYGGEEAARLPRDRWPELVHARQLVCTRELSADCRALLFYVQDAAKNEWLGFVDRERYVREGLGLDPDLVVWALEGLRKLDRDQAVRFDQAVVLGKRGAPKGNQNAAKGDDENKGSATTIDSVGRGTEYQLARLRRDRPDLAAKVVSGSLSANAAAIEAGFRRKTITIPTEPSAAAEALARHFTHEALREIHGRLAEMIECRAP